MRAKMLLFSATNSVNTEQENKNTGDYRFKARSATLHMHFSTFFE